MKSMTVAQVSDLHLFASRDERLLGCETDRSAALVMQVLADRRPDLVLVMGDVSQDGSRASYERAAGLLADLRAPCACLPGNHDHTVTMRRVLRGGYFLDETSFRWMGWRFELLDTQAPGQTYGSLSESTLHGLRRGLHGSDEAPVFIGMHHPALPVGSAWLDRIGLQEAAAFLALVQAFPKVRIVSAAHVHQDTHRRYFETDFYTTRSAGFQFMAGSEEFAIDAEAQPAFRLFHLYEDGTHDTLIHEVAYRCELDLSAEGY